MYMVCSCLLCGYFPDPMRFSDFFHSRPTTLKERTRPNTLNLDSPPNEAKNSTAESNCKGLTSFQLSSHAIASLRAKPGGSLFTQ